VEEAIGNRVNGDDTAMTTIGNERKREREREVERVHTWTTRAH
jgi:hypothetical protein